ncbi:unnamed protein product, partial [Sphagnum balticum]
QQQQQQQQELGVVMTGIFHLFGRKNGMETSRVDARRASVDNGEVAKSLAERNKDAQLLAGNQKPQPARSSLDSRPKPGLSFYFKEDAPATKNSAEPVDAKEDEPSGNSFGSGLLQQQQQQRNSDSSPLAVSARAASVIKRTMLPAKPEEKEKKTSSLKHAIQHPPPEGFLSGDMDQRLRQLRLRNYIQERKTLKQILEAMRLKGLLHPHSPTVNAKDLKSEGVARSLFKQHKVPQEEGVSTRNTTARGAMSQKPLRSSSQELKNGLNTKEALPVYARSRHQRTSPAAARTAKVLSDVSELALHDVTPKGTTRSESYLATKLRQGKETSPLKPSNNNNNNNSMTKSAFGSTITRVDSGGGKVRAKSTTKDHEDARVATPAARRQLNSSREFDKRKEVLVKKPHTLQECEGGQLVESAEQPSPVSVLDNTHFQEHEFTPNLELAKANCVSSFHDGIQVVNTERAWATTTQERTCNSAVARNLSTTTAHPSEENTLAVSADNNPLKDLFIAVARSLDLDDQDSYLNKPTMEIQVPYITDITATIPIAPAAAHSLASLQLMSKDDDRGYVRHIMVVSGVTEEEWSSLNELWPPESGQQIINTFVYDQTEEHLELVEESTNTQNVCLGDVDEEQERQQQMLNKKRTLNRRILFDSVNDILLRILNRYLNHHPHKWRTMMSTSPCLLRKKSTGEKLVQEVWGEIQEIVSAAACGGDFLCTIFQKDFAQKGEMWLDLSAELGKLGTEMEDLIFDEMLDELVDDMMSQLYVWSNRTDWYNIIQMT